MPWAAVPIQVADLVRPGLPGVVEDIIAAVRAEVVEYDQPLEGEFGRLIREGAAAALEQFVDLLGRDVDLPPSGVYEAIGRAEFRAGRTLDALQSAYRVGARVAWRAAVDLAAASLDSRALVAFAEAIFAYIDRLADAAVSGYAREQSMREGSAQTRRHALVDVLLRGEARDPAVVERAAEQAGWALPAQLAVVALGDEDPLRVMQRMPVGTIGTTLDAGGVLVVPDPDGPGRRRQLVVGLRRRLGVLGPTVPWARAHESARRALTAWPLHAAGRLGEHTLARSDEHLLDLALMADEALARDFVETRLAPLRHLKPAARERATLTLRAWLDAHGDVTATARGLHVHPQSVRYRLARLRETFAGALDDPAARLEIAAALRASDLLAG
ncbi:MAG TPA: helix-turn-helix domain-containing protein [Solirubrobacter sp.]|nr:helix-turn-helix domain-containing protein [Solirubrobacter sp.]